MGERKGTKGLELWCRRMTEGYPGVNVTNMTTSWRDGLAFCAIIHHFRPDLIEFSKLNKDDIYHNNELAFRIAERHLGIPALLEPEDMVEFPVPDRLSILTYLSQFYQAFVVGQGKSPSRIATKRPTDSPDHSIGSPPSTSPTSKMPTAAKIRREPCAKCNLPVFIAERLNVGKLLYHRTCFRCARCNSQLTLANYYETENHEYCCEMCPDEEKLSQSQQPQPPNIVDTTTVVLSRSLSDEEKSASLKKMQTMQESQDTYSANFETALENTDDNTLKRNATLTDNARTFFINDQLNDHENSGGDDDGDETTDEEQQPDNEKINEDKGGGGDRPPDLPQSLPPPLVVGKSDLKSNGDSDSFPIDNNVNIVDNTSSSRNKNNNSSNDNNLSDKNNKIVTKEIIPAPDRPVAEEKVKNSLVKARMQLFEQSQVENLKSELKNDTKVPSNDIAENENEIEKKQEEEEEIIEELEKSFNNDNISNKISDDLIEKKEFEIDDNSVITIQDSSNESIIEISSDSIQIVPEDNDNTIKTEESEHNDSKRKSIEYPEELNPFGDDDNDNNDEKPITVEETKEKQVVETPKPAVRKKIKATSVDNITSPLQVQRISVNPFEDDEDDEVQEEAPESIGKRKIEAPRISLNPFWSDDEDNPDKPIAKPRISKSSTTAQDTTSISTFDSSTSLSSAHSYGTERRKKKMPAPRPPTESATSSLTSSPSHSVTHSPKGTPRIRKNRKAPLPPSSISPKISTTSTTQADEDIIEHEKLTKDQLNRNRQSQSNLPPIIHTSPSSSENSQSLTLPDKSTYGKWKRKKGQAPTRPIPQRRTVKALPLVEVKRELEIIEIQQQGLERQGVKLEQIIRDKCEGGDDAAGNNDNADEPLSPEIDDLILQLFELVNEKNELFRKQAELMYLRRQHRLEEEHAEVEYQIRCLMLQPEANKTDSDKAKEEELLQRLVAIVEKRDEIIQCLEMDRVREAEEDDCINSQLNLYTQKKEGKSPTASASSQEVKEKKKFKKKFKLKSHKQKVDADKDIDECETQQQTTTSPKKDKKKKKFNLF